MLLRGSPPPFIALAGSTREACIAGINPNSTVMPIVSAIPNPNTIESGLSSNAIRTSIKCEIRSTTNGVAHHANSVPRAAAATPTIALSTITSRASRARPAPSDTRTAISRARVDTCPLIRFATLTHAISKTIPTSTANAISGASSSPCISETPWLAFTSTTFQFRKLSSVCLEGFGRRLLASFQTSSRESRWTGIQLAA